MVTPDLADRFVAGAVSAGAEVFRAVNRRAALAAVAGLLRDEGIPEVLAARALFAEAKAAGLEARPLTNAADIAAARAAVVRADYGAAETGTLVHLDADDEEKLAWTLPPLCVCLLDLTAIVSDLEALAGVIADHLARPAIPGPQVSLVTGPSRTADIECQLTIGVQGPARLVIGLIGGEESRA